MMTKDAAIAEIHKALDEIRPFLNSDGGDISFIELTEDQVVRVQLHGACMGCAVNQMTLKTGVEMTIKKYVPQVTRVEEISAVL